METQSHPEMPLRDYGPFQRGASPTPARPRDLTRSAEHNSGMTVAAKFRFGQIPIRITGRHFPMKDRGSMIFQHLIGSGAAWGRQAWRNRYVAAGYIQVIIDVQKIDGEAPFFDAQGRLQLDCQKQSEAQSLVVQYPLIGHWLASLGGPTPDAHRAQDALVEILKNPRAIFETIVLLFDVLATIDNELLAAAVQTSFEAALTDSRITACGAIRPWLANTGEHKFDLKGTHIDFSADIADIECYWRTGLELIDIIDTGDRIGTSDFPSPYQPICDALEKVSLDSTIEETDG